MNPRATRPVLAALALAATAALTSACGASAPSAAAPATTVTTTTTAPASPSAPASQPASTAPVAATSSGPAAPGCLARYLHGALANSDDAAGSVYLDIEFKNLDNVSCTMYGYPGVAVSRGLPIRLVGATAGEDPSTSRELVTLPPHGYAHAQLRVTDALDYQASSCRPVRVKWLQVIPPNQVAGLYIPFTFQSWTCRNAATQTMTVGAVRPGQGP
jgi:Protein of unknown function (DUF4232)